MPHRNLDRVFCLEKAPFVCPIRQGRTNRLRIWKKLYVHLKSSQFPRAFWKKRWQCFHQPGTSQEVQANLENEPNSQPVKVGSLRQSASKPSSEQPCGVSFCSRSYSPPDLEQLKAVERARTVEERTEWRDPTLPSDDVVYHDRTTTPSQYR